MSTPTLTAPVRAPQPQSDSVLAAAAAVKAAAPATATYKFNEGYTNAVRRPLRMADLL